MTEHNVQNIGNGPVLRFPDRIVPATVTHKYHVASTCVTITAPACEHGSRLFAIACEYGIPRKTIYRDR